MCEIRGCPRRLVLFLRGIFRACGVVVDSKHGALLGLLPSPRNKSRRRDRGLYRVHTYALFGIKCHINFRLNSTCTVYICLWWNFQFRYRVISIKVFFSLLIPRQLEIIRCSHGGHSQFSLHATQQVDNDLSRFCCFQTLPDGKQERSHVYAHLTPRST